MEIRRRRLDFKKVFVWLYFLAFAVYIINGLRPADAISYDIETSLNIPSIDLVSDVTRLQLVDHALDTPDAIVGSFSYDDSKMLLIGHSSTVFNNLHYINYDDEIIYKDHSYKVKAIQTLKKDDINMAELLSPAKEDTLVIMTCAGQDLPNRDATHRLIVTATKTD